MSGKDFVEFVKLAYLTVLDPIKALQRALAPGVRQVAVEIKFIDSNRLLDYSAGDWFEHFGQIRSCSSVEPVFDSREDVDFILNILVQLRTDPEVCDIAEAWVCEGIDTSRLGKFVVVDVKVLDVIKVPRAKRQPKGAETLGEFVASDVMHLLAGHVRALTSEFVIADPHWDKDASKIICGPLVIKIIRDEDGDFYVHIIETDCGEDEIFQVTSIGTDKFKKTLRDMAVEAGAVPRDRPYQEH
jgi:hypothetical protein